MDAIISLTTIAQRVALLPEVLRTLIHQSVAPSRIILWISSEPYLLDSGVACQDLPREVREMARDASNPVEIRTTENIGPHRKLLPALAALADDPDPPPIITADDDTLYPCRWLEALLTAYETHGCAITFRARQIPAHFDKLAPYAEWPLIPPYEEVLGRRLLATGKDGLLVHPRMLHPAIRESHFRTLCPSRADAWITGALQGAGTPLLKLSLSRVFPDESGLQPVATAFPGPNACRNDDVDSLNKFNVEFNDGALAKAFEFFRERSAVARP